MSHLESTFARIFATNPSAPKPIAPEALEALRVRADIEHLQHRGAWNYHQALHLQVQQQAQGVM